MPVMHLGADGVETHPATDDAEDDISKLVEETDRANAAKRAQIMQEFEEKLFVKERRDEARLYANSLFKSEKLSDAAAAYERIMPFCDTDEQRTTLLSNIAAVRIKQWRWTEALSTCDRVLQYDASHAKALYRRAQAQRGLRDTAGALETIACARAAGGGKKSAELDLLERHVRSDIKRVEDAQEEKRAAELRKEKRLLEAAAKARRKEEANRPANAIQLPPAVPEEASQGYTRDWSAWLAREVTQRFMDEESRMMIYEEDGWVQVTDVPASRLDVDARIITTADGSRSLFYDLSVTLICQVAQFRGTWDDPGCMSFKVEVTLEGIDNMSVAADWTAQAKLTAGFNYTARVEKMMERYVRLQYLEHAKQLAGECIEKLETKCAVALQATGDSCLGHNPTSEGAPAAA